MHGGVACNPSTGEAEAGVSWVGLGYTVIPKNKKINKAWKCSSMYSICLACTTPLIQSLPPPKKKKKKERN
jgi:hypothetical protein